MSSTTGRIAQVGVEALHEQLPAEAALARIGQITLETVRDTADLPATRGRITQVAAELTHDHLPADTGTGRLAQISIEVVRAVTEVAVSSTSRVQVVMIAA